MIHSGPFSLLAHRIPNRKKKSENSGKRINSLPYDWIYLLGVAVVELETGPQNECLSFYLVQVWNNQINEFLSFRPKVNYNRKMRRENAIYTDYYGISSAPFFYWKCEVELYAWVRNYSKKGFGIYTNMAWGQFPT